VCVCVCVVHFIIHASLVLHHSHCPQLSCQTCWDLDNQWKPQKFIVPCPVALSTRPRSYSSPPNNGTWSTGFPASHPLCHLKIIMKGTITVSDKLQSHVLINPINDFAALCFKSRTSKPARSCSGCLQLKVNSEDLSSPPPSLLGTWGSQGGGGCILSLITWQNGAYDTSHLSAELLCGHHRSLPLGWQVSSKTYLVWL
jgi:hypothetical protein